MRNAFSPSRVPFFAKTQATLLPRGSFLWHQTKRLRLLARFVSPRLEKGPKRKRGESSEEQKAVVVFRFALALRRARASSLTSIRFISSPFFFFFPFSWIFFFLFLRFARGGCNARYLISLVEIVRALATCEMRERERRE